MEIKNIKKKETRSVKITIRTYPKSSKWMKDNEISPSALFNEAVKELTASTKRRGKK